jgi:hypothetical protein
MENCFLVSHYMKIATIVTYIIVHTWHFASNIHMHDFNFVSYIKGAGITITFFSPITASSNKFKIYRWEWKGNWSWRNSTLGTSFLKWRECSICLKLAFVCIFVMISIFFLILLYVNLTLVLYACVLWAIWACKCIFMRNIWDLLNYRVFSKHKYLFCHRLIICFNPTLGYNCGVFSKIWQQHKFKKWFHSSMWLPNMNFGIGIYVFTN